VYPAGELKTPQGLIVRPWSRHEGAARVLVRRLKYEGIEAVAHLVAAELVDAIPDSVRCLVPVMRTPARRLRYGIDPATSIAKALSVRSGIPVVKAVAPPLWHPPNAGAARDGRRAPDFRARTGVFGALLVDDVVTTGATLDAAAAVVGHVGLAVTATGVP
jgi:predicted amidophosphoribosyltransferase